MIVTFYGGPHDGEERDITDNIECQSREWRFPCPRQSSIFAIASGKIELPKVYVYRSEPGCSIFYYQGIQ